MLRWVYMACLMLSPQELVGPLGANKPSLLKPNEYKDKGMKQEVMSEGPDELLCCM